MARLDADWWADTRGYVSPLPAYCDVERAAVCRADRSVPASLGGGRSAQMWVQDAPVTFGEPLSPGRGWVPFHIQAALSGSTPLQLLRQEEAGAAVEVSTADLWPQPPDGGLAVSVLTNAWVSHRIDPFVGAGVGGTTGGGAGRPAPALRDPGLLAPGGCAE